MKTKLFTGLNVDLKNIVAISDIVKETVCTGPDGYSRIDTVFYIHLKYVPNPARYVFPENVYQEAVEAAKDDPEAPFVPERREDVCYELDAMNKFWEAETKLYEFVIDKVCAKREQQHAELISMWEDATRLVDES